LAIYPSFGQECEGILTLKALAGLARAGLPPKDGDMTSLGKSVRFAK